MFPQSNTGFQQFVNQQLAPGVPGDFAGANIKGSANAPEGGFVAALAGVLIGAFAWGDPASGFASNFYQVNSALGFVHREMQALITVFLGISGMTIPSGLGVTLLNQGDFWALFSGGATVGQKVYADPVTGLCTAGAAGAGVAGTMTGSIAVGGLMTISAITGTPLAVGQGVNVVGAPAGSYISALGSGTGGTGTYQLANANGAAYVIVTSTTINYTGPVETPFYVASNVKVNASVTASIATSGVMTVTAVGSGVLTAGQFISGAAVPANYQIQQQLTGSAGSTGTYLLNLAPTTAVSSTTITATQGQVGKISSWGA